MCDLFTRGLQAVGTKRHKLLLRNEDCTAHVAVTPFTNFLITFLKKVRSCEHKCLQITSGYSYVEMYKMDHLGWGGGRRPHGFPGTCSSTELWMWLQGPSTLCWKLDARARISGGDYCRLLPVTCFVEVLVILEMVKQKLGKAGFFTWSGCFDLQSVLPAVERKHHLMSPLCMFPWDQTAGAS